MTTLFPSPLVDDSIEKDIYLYLVRLPGNIRIKASSFFSNQMEQFFGEHYAAAREGMKRICAALHADHRAVQIKKMNDANDPSKSLPLEDCPQTLVEILATAIGMTSAEDLHVSKVLSNLQYCSLCNNIFRSPDLLLPCLKTRSCSSAKPLVTKNVWFSLTFRGKMIGTLTSRIRNLKRRIEFLTSLEVLPNVKTYPPLSQNWRFRWKKVFRNREIA